MRKTPRATLVLVLAAAAANAGEGNAVSLFDGRDLSGWQHVGDGRFVLQHGMLKTEGGVKVTDYTEGQPVPPKGMWYEPDRGPRTAEGYIGLQNHGEPEADAG